ncbi:prephenate dehydratase [Corynebacterium freiburgense]|uniref:prephenate dehydratase n=1 Tax=Corynebacterium freiburgense TaxID=556548 RepID=UPI000478C8FC|nr:prephenate dehydratase [Corynebacterium freiburgense]WJZ03879.1 Prephenate dehydratase [Corynebacterium freiburgense]
MTKVAFLGPAGTFTEEALWRFVGMGCFEGEVVPLGVGSPGEALDAVRNGDAEFAVVAIENSVDGSVTPTFDALAGNGVQIFQETDIEVMFSILVRPGTKEIRTFATHPVARQQVRGWLAEHLPGVEFVAASSNAAAAQMVAEGRVDAAAAPGRAAELFGLERMADEVADVRGARTRFVVVGRPGVPTRRSGADRTAVVFTLPNKPGSLVGALTEFALRGVDMSRIESRPTRTGLGTYRFHVDLIGHIDDAPIAEALRALYLRCEQLSFLGSWPTLDIVSRTDTDRLAEAAAWVDAAQKGQCLC